MPKPQPTQAEIAFAPVVVEKSPVAQDKQTSTLVAPVDVDHVPATQLVQAEAPGLDHVPDTHCAQAAKVEAPCAFEDVPCGQFKQNCAVEAPVAVE